MNESERIAGELRKALDGEAWHGPSLRQALEGVTAHAAADRPVAAAHSIAEISRHIATWNDVVRRRIGGESPTVSEDQDWPVFEITPPSWDRLREEVLETGKSLVEAIRAFPPARLHDERPGVGGTWHELMLGQLQHVVYHSGQISLLRKAAKSRS